jgi:tetratricopeptide (TPR) repeat protein
VTVDVAEAAAPVVDTKRPWPGLDAFTEALSPFFFGRNAEADELFRRVRRDVATLLFGQSGLGKTSLLQAGLFPRLRWAGFLPILIRLDHSPGAPAPGAQVKAAIEREVSAADLSEVTPIGVEESLWGYFHRADRRLADYAGEKIVPVLVFDQFEELYTQGLANDDRRATSQDFLGELAELVENRPPEALERAIEADPDLVESFSFDRHDYRIVLALREDFLASLESLRSRAPSLGRNRYRLRRMSGRQGLDAILSPAPGLVAPEVAQEIIRFIGRASAEDAFGIAGDAAEGFEVEPPLLSLVCRELNERRIARGLDQIGADLLAGSRDDIIEGFYERSLADQPAALRAFVEDRLLTPYGFRESVTLDTARHVLSDSGVAAGALDELVHRRLLRTEERLGIPRIEIIHDVLTPVIRRSRDSRHLRQAEAAAAEREEALHRERRRVRRAHYLVAAMAVLFLVTVGVAWWGWSSKLEAKRQHTVAEEQRALAEQQRNFAEEQRAAAAAESKRAEQNFGLAVTTADSMITLADRLRELTGVPTVTIRDILKSAEGAFEGIAAAAPNSQHLRWRRAVMLVSFAYTYHTLGDNDEALRRATASSEIMRSLVNEDPDSDPWATELAVSLRAVGDALCVEDGGCQGDLDRALANYRDDLRIMTRLTSKDPDNSNWQDELARAHSRIGQVNWAQGNLAAALTEYRTDLDISQRLAEKDPDGPQWQHGLAESHEKVGFLLDEQGDLAAALFEYRTALDIRQRLAERNPGNVKWQRNLLASHWLIGRVYGEQHDLGAALTEYRTGLDLIQGLAGRDPGNAQWQHDLATGHVAVGDALSGQDDLAGALGEYRNDLDIVQGLAEKDPGNREWQRDLSIGHERIGDVLRAQGEFTGALAEYSAALDINQRLAEKDPGNAQWQRDLFVLYTRIGLVSYQRIEFPAALDAFEKAEKIALHVKEINPTAALSAQDVAWVQTRLEATHQKMAASATAEHQEVAPLKPRVPSHRRPAPHGFRHLAR